MRIKRCYSYIILILITLVCTLPAGKYFESGSWIMEAPNLDSSFFKTKEARRIGNNLLFYQHYLGGFPKNILYQMPIDYEKILTKKWLKQNSFSSIDNDATTTEIIYLAKLYHFTKEKFYKDAVIIGINFLISKQYENGGYPQKFRTKLYPYQREITFNDNAMINVLKLLNDVSNKTYPFEFIDNETAEKAKTALDKGIQCILKCQIKQNGVLTAWCAQHNKDSLLPCDGRIYEKAAINAKESANIVLFLMSIKNPSLEVINSIEAAVKWFQKSQITGVEQKRIIKADKYNDFTLEPCNNCTPIWGRFYDIKTNKIFYCDRDGIRKNNINEISKDRRMGYDWFGSEGLDVLNKYKVWKEQF